MAKKKTAPEVPPKPAPIGFGRRATPDEADDTRSSAPAPEEEEGILGELRNFITDRRKALKKKDDDQELDLLDPNFDALMAEIGQRFEVADSLEEAGLRLTTKEVFDRLQSFYPSLYYGVQSVFNALKELGFKYDDPFKDMNFVWLFK